MKKAKILLSALLVLVTVFSLNITSLAASTRNVTTGGNGKTSTVMTVKTKKKTTLKFTQKKGQISFQNKATGISKKNVYGDFFIYVVDQSGKERPKNYTCSLKEACSITLSANKTYKITISPQAKSLTYRKLINAGELWYRSYLETTFQWTKTPAWTVNIKNVYSLQINKVVKAPQQ